jgi:hypothetical protein
MAANPLLAKVSDLATLLEITLDDEDPYALLIMRQASNAVRDAAKQPGWVRLDDPENDEPGPGQAVAPPVAEDITLQVAARAYTDPRNLASKGSGPIRESYFENGFYGTDLRPQELARLRGVSGNGNRGLWVQPISYGEPVTPILAPSELGYWYLADSDQFPYADPSQA